MVSDPVLMTRALRKLEKRLFYGVDYNAAMTARVIDALRARCCHRYAGLIATIAPGQMTTMVYSPWVVLIHLDELSLRVVEQEADNDVKDEKLEKLDIVASIIVEHMSIYFGAQCDFNTKQFDGLSPLHYAVRNCGAHTVDAVCRYGGAVISESDADIMNDVAAADPGVIRALAQHRVMPSGYELVNRRVLYGGTALHRVCADTTLPPDELAACVRYLIQLGVDPTFLNDDRVSPRAVLAATRGGPANVLAMLEANENPRRMWDRVRLVLRMPRMSPDIARSLGRQMFVAS
jgi:hypothetical protein